MLLSLDSVMKNVDKLNGIKNSAINLSRVLKVEAKLDEYRDITGNKHDII